MSQASVNFKTTRLWGIEQVVEHWPLFCEGLSFLNRLVPAEKHCTPEMLLNVIASTLRKGKDKGHVAVYESDKHGVIGFTVTFASDSPFDTVPTAVIYAAYARRTVPGASRFGLSHVEKWARASGFKELQAYTPRINGKGFALFEKRFKFRRFLVCFYKSL